MLIRAASPGFLDADDVQVCSMPEMDETGDSSIGGEASDVMGGNAETRSAGRKTGTICRVTPEGRGGRGRVGGRRRGRRGGRAGRVRRDGGGRGGRKGCESSGLPIGSRPGEDRAQWQSRWLRRGGMRSSRGISADACQNRANCATGRLGDAGGRSDQRCLAGGQGVQREVSAVRRLRDDDSNTIR